MAIAAGMRTYLRDVIGLVDPADRREAVRNKGLENITNLVEFNGDGIKVSCGSVRKLGGTICEPTTSNPNRTIPNPGHSIPAICEKCLKWAAYGARVYNMIRRAITADSLSRTRFCVFEELHHVIKEHDEPESLPIISKTFRVMKAIDAIPVHL
mmetsp:Transcript_14822/g.21197  ORF Transcript_14822/g.21197 Transcript_14822/m.21197 type:complete len:154 (+) Transcript_14822:41-502(+)|eukprot:CAMPEP_0184866772 /NCGR_PEP_ID=MMETSP0580-20130426/23646_1 /TAXON_ID=1118495 /ORGANISM="Dactyliosolen fragilissimus" /LENGTH=153 /DNA_ID=CAMNT_0027366631 /DNA_START=16 /DNA_END=477 /DNA_ORIENTATION=+